MKKLTQQERTTHLINAAARFCVDVVHQRDNLMGVLFAVTGWMEDTPPPYNYAMLRTRIDTLNKWIMESVQAKAGS